MKHLKTITAFNYKIDYFIKPITEAGAKLGYDYIIISFTYDNDNLICKQFSYKRNGIQKQIYKTIIY